MSAVTLSLTRILQSQGFGSRKQCRACIASGAVSINGHTITNPEQHYAVDGLEFAVHGERWRYRQHATLMLHKPAGHECSRAPRHHPSVFALLPAPLLQRGVQPAGRLDHDASGLLVLTDDGQLIHRLCSPRHAIAKTYRVHTAETFTPPQQAQLLDGVLLHGETTPSCATACVPLADKLLELTLTSGRYHQVKRMLAACGNHVVRLHRIRIGALDLPEDLAAGQWRWIEPQTILPNWI